jgi:hypothetical protein
MGMIAPIAIIALCGNDTCLAGIIDRAFRGR